MIENTEYILAAREQMRDDPTEPTLESLGTRFVSEFSQAVLDRSDTEQRWLCDLRQYKGQYDPDVLAAIGPVRSRAFVRKTRVKVKTIDSRVADLLFPAGSEKNWEVTNTSVPSVSREQRQAVASQLSQLSQGQMPTNDVVDDAVMKLVKEASKKMSKVIDDQLTEARYKEVSVKAVHSGHLYGAGILKGPLVERKIRTRFVKEGEAWVAKSETYAVPFVDYVPLWRFYPDMAATELEHCRYVYERHHMTKADMVGLSAKRSFRKAVVIAHIKANPRGQKTLVQFDNDLKQMGERNSRQSQDDGQYEVLERWGYVDGLDLKNCGVKVPEDRLHESFFSNVWLLPNGQVIKAVLQPIDGVTWPYHLYYFDKDETSIFGEGLASVMRDDQTNLNAAHRLMFDNAAITSGPMLEITPGLLSTSERTMEAAPWKIWLRNAQAPGSPAVRAITIPSNLNELSQLAARCENNADEVTAIPRYMSGENATQGAAGTAAGMSMLMGAANIVIKDLITSWDEGVTRTFLTGMYRWNMQFNKDASIKGDFDVKARGTASLVAKEVRARQLNEFSASTANEMDAPFVKREQLLRQRAEANELGDVVKTEEEIKAEQDNEGSKAAAEFQGKLAQMQMTEAQAKVDKLIAEAQQLIANAKLITAKAVATKVDTAYVALQAGGVATERPQIAPAGDEILKSSGWSDLTPDPSMAQLGGPPVQPEQAGQIPGQIPGQAGQPPVEGAAPAPEDIDPESAQMELPSPGRGKEAGIETPVIE